MLFGSVESLERKTIKVLCENGQKENFNPDRCRRLLMVYGMIRFGAISKERKARVGDRIVYDGERWGFADTYEILKRSTAA